MDKNKFKYSMALIGPRQKGAATAPNQWRKVDKYCTLEETFRKKK